MLVNSTTFKYNFDWQPSEAASSQDVSIEQEAEKDGNLMERLTTLSGR